MRSFISIEGPPVILLPVDAYGTSTTGEGGRRRMKESEGCPAGESETCVAEEFSLLQDIISNPSIGTRKKTSLTVSRLITSVPPFRRSAKLK